MINEYLGNMLIGAVSGLVLALSGYFKSRDNEYFDFKKLLPTVGISILSGILFAALGFSPWQFGSENMSLAVTYEGGLMASITYVFQSIVKAFQRA